MAIGDIKSAEIGTGARYNTGKPPISLIPLKMIARSYQESEFYADQDVRQYIKSLARLGDFQQGHGAEALWDSLLMLGDRRTVWDETAYVFEFGKAKYAAWNWAKGMPWSVPLECAARHLRAMIEGQWTDDDSKLPHRGHVGCNVVMLLHYLDMPPSVRQSLDDRPPAHLFVTQDPTVGVVLT